MYSDKEVRKALRKRPKYFVGKNLDERVSRKELVRRQEAEKAATYIGRAFLIKTGTFTASKLDSYEKKGILTARKDRRLKLYRKEDVVGLIEAEAKEMRSRYL